VVARVEEFQGMDKTRVGDKNRNLASCREKFVLRTSHQATWRPEC
jgi:hypothetical protein